MFQLARSILGPTPNVGTLPSYLVATDRGVGFFDCSRGELRLPFGIHVSPPLQSIRPATEEEAKTYFEHRMGIRRELAGYYDRKTFTGD